MGTGAMEVKLPLQGEPLPPPPTHLILVCRGLPPSEPTLSMEVRFALMPSRVERVQMGFENKHATPLLFGKVLKRLWNALSPHKMDCAGRLQEGCASDFEGFFFFFWAQGILSLPFS